jgi:hypothetical protein
VQWSGGEEEQVGRRVAANALLLGNACGREEPNQSPREREEPSASKGEPGQSRKQDAAVNTDDAPPSSSSRRRLHRRPDVSRSATLSSHAPSPLLDFACGRAFKSPRTVRAAPPFLRRRPPRHAAPVRTRQPWPPQAAMSGALVSKSLCCSMVCRTKDYPATRRRAMRRARVAPCVLVDGLRAVVVLFRDKVEPAVTARTPAPMSSPRLPPLTSARQCAVMNPCR